MISSQKGTDFTGSHYEKIQKVYSIWICTKPPKYRKNTITRYRFHEENVVGTVKEKVENYDLIEIVMVCLGSPEEEAKEELLRLLSVVLAKQLDIETKKQILKTEFHIIMENDTEKEISQMCNLGEGIWEEGRESLLKEKIQKKLQKGKTIEQIADELEESVEMVRELWCEMMEYV